MQQAGWSLLWRWVDPEHGRYSTMADAAARQHLRPDVQVVARQLRDLCKQERHHVTKQPLSTADGRAEAA